MTPGQRECVTFPPRTINRDRCDNQRCAWRQKSIVTPIPRVLHYTPLSHGKIGVQGGGGAVEPLYFLAHPMSISERYLQRSELEGIKRLGQQQQTNVEMLRCSLRREDLGVQKPCKQGNAAVTQTKDRIRSPPITPPPFNVYPRVSPWHANLNLDGRYTRSKPWISRSHITPPI